MGVQMIFVNLPVKDLNKSMDFFSKVGFTFNPQFTDENATSMVISDTIYAMLLVEDYFKTFTKKEIADAQKTTEAIIALTVNSKEEVDELVNKALEAGAKHSKEKTDYGFMYEWGFEDIDGHLWEIVWMNPEAMNG